VSNQKPIVKAGYPSADHLSYACCCKYMDLTITVFAGQNHAQMKFFKELVFSHS